VRSVYAKILLWSFATLVLSLIAFVGVSALVSFQTANRTGFFGQVHSLELEEAREAYEEGGPAKLAQFLERVHRRLSGWHYLTDGRGRDLLTGTDRSALLAVAEPEGSPPRHLGGPRVVVATAEDGRYRWIVEFGPPPVDLKSFLPYYALIFGAVALVCWALAVNIASPLRSLARTVDRFGAGDLGVRVNSTRKDEIGELSSAFDRMAERIGTLLTAERRLLQDISHELRSPLARLGFAAELVRTASDRDAAVERLKKEIHRLTDLVGALLQVTMAEGDPSSTVPERLRLDGLLMEVVEDCRVEADGRGCTIALRTETPLAVMGDHEVLRRAIENVIRNSIRYAPQESKVEVDLAATKGAASISVRDYGPGVPEEALPKIFQPFFRVDNSRDSSTGGMGLGLAIAMRAVGLHHGQLRAQNAYPGLRVLIELPIEAAL
jgi:two-component system sensor histidine kinase CpxA